MNRKLYEDDLAEAFKGYMPEKDPVNHVKSNILLSGKINTIRNIKTFYRNYIN